MKYFSDDFSIALFFVYIDYLLLLDNYIISNFYRIYLGLLNMVSDKFKFIAQLILITLLGEISILVSSHAEI